MKEVIKESIKYILVGSGSNISQTEFELIA